MTTKLIIGLGLALVAIGFMLGWWAHPDVPEQVGYNPPLPDSNRIALLESRLDSASHMADSLLTEIRKRDRAPRYWHAARMDTIPPLVPLGVTLMDSADCAEMVARRDSAIGFLAFPWTEEHRWSAEKKDSTFIAGRVRIPVDPVHKTTDPTVKVDSVWVRVPPGEDVRAKTVIMWSLFTLAVGLFGGKLL